MIKLRLIAYVCWAISTIGLGSCSPESEPINYGKDACEYCRMSIVDQKFGCELVTTKGKAFKFDAVECMVNYIDNRIEDEAKLKLILTNTLDKPAKLSDATKCTYLISKNMPSPMGMFLNPVFHASEAQKFQKEHSGDLFNWKGLRAEFAQYK